MKPYDYYNYAKPRRKIWWLPLALVLLLVAVSWIVRSCGSEDEAPLPTGPSALPVGPVEQGWHTVLIDGTLYNVLDRDDLCEYDLQRICFAPAGSELPAWADLQIPQTGLAAFPEDFPLQAVLDRADYEALCRRWGLRPAFPLHEGRFAVILAARSGSAEPQLRVGGLRLRGSAVTAVLRERYARRDDHAAGYALVFPVPDSAAELKLEPLYLPDELPAAGSAAAESGAGEP